MCLLFDYLFKDKPLPLPKIDKSDITLVRGDKNFKPSRIISNDIRNVSRSVKLQGNGCSRRGHGIV